MREIKGSKNREERPALVTLDGRVEWAYNAREQAICYANTKSGGKCQSISLGPNGRCRMHNGFKKSGEAHPNYTHGRYSTLLPRKYKRLFNDLLADENLLSMSPDIAYNDVITLDMYGDLLALDPHVTKALSSHSRESAALLASSEVEYDELEHHLRRFIALADMLGQEQSLQSSIQKSQEHRRRLAETESKMKSNATANMPAAQAFAIVTALMLAVREEVTNPEDIRRVGKRLQNILTLPNDANNMGLDLAEIDEETGEME